MRRSLQRVVGGGFLFLLGVLACSSRDNPKEDTATVQEGLTQAEISRILSFEGTIGTSGDWVRSGSGTVASSTVHAADGTHSMVISGASSISVVSASLSALGSVGPSMTLQVWLPTQLNGASYKGQVQAFFNSTTLPFNNQPQPSSPVGFGSLTPGQFSTVTIPLDSSVYSKLSQSGYSDLKVTFKFDLADTTDPTYVDKLVFATGTGGSGGATGTGGSKSNGGATGIGGTKSVGGATGAGGTNAGGTKSGGAPSTGGTKSTGGTTGTGGKATGGITGSGGKSTGGLTGTGGKASGGTTGTGGKASGGTTGTGGKASGGTSATGGSKTTGGTSSTGGSIATGGTKTTGGTSSTGGTIATGGTKATGGATFAPTGGMPATGGLPATGGAIIVVGTGGTPATGGVPALGGNISSGGTSSGGSITNGGLTGGGNGGTTGFGGSTSIDNAGGTAGTGGTGTPPVPYTFSFQLPAGVNRNQVVFATTGGDLWVDDGVQAVNGNGFASVSAVGGGKVNRIGVSTQVQDIWSGGDVVLANNAEVHGSLTTSGSVNPQPGAKVDGTTTQQATLGPLQTISWTINFPTITDGAINVTNTQTFTPNGYPEVDIKTGTQINLSTGTYTFNAMMVEPGGVINIDNSLGPVFIYLKNGFTFRGVVNTTSTQPNVLFGIAGTSPVVIDASFNGIVVAPSAALSLSTTTSGHSGAFFAQSITAHQNTTTTLQSLQPTNFCGLSDACSSFCSCPGGRACNGNSANCDTGLTCDSATNTCQCQPDCSQKHCGDAPSSGCGICTSICANGQGGCTQDSDCPSGSVCGKAIGARFGLAGGTNVCWPVTCQLQDSTLPNGGVDPLTCGASPACVPKCKSGAAGPDGCGSYCGSCPSGQVRGPTGDCTLVIGHIWGPDETAQTLAQSLLAPHSPPQTSANFIPNSDDLFDYSRLVPPLGAASTPGAIPASFAVSDRGEATYTIPISVPPGRLGIQPNLSLSYRSNKVNGMLGMGWALSGLSTITRCPRIVGREGKARAVMFDSTDTFCLDGQALVYSVINGYANEYRTENDNFSKILPVEPIAGDKRYHGPKYFTVYTKDGRILQYGDDSDGSNSVIRTSNDVARVWALSSVKDRFGNLMQVRYKTQDIVGEQLDAFDSGQKLPNDVNSVGELVPDVISYGGNFEASDGSVPHTRFVQFKYNENPYSPDPWERPDPVMQYQWGVKSYSTLRLTSISTFIGTNTTPILQYQISYNSHEPNQTSLISSVSLCGGNQICLQPTTFEYEPENTTWGATETLDTQTVSVPCDVNVKLELDVLDVNGDGLDDILTRIPAPDTTCVGQGMRSTCNLRLSEMSGSWSLLTSQNGANCLAFPPQNYRVEVPTKNYHVMDIDGDGRDEIVAVKGNNLVRMRPTGNIASFESAFENLGFVKGSLPGSSVMADIDGNGFNDLVFDTGVLLNHTPQMGVLLNHTSQANSDSASLNPGLEYRLLAATATPHGATSTDDLDGDGAVELMAYMGVTRWDGSSGFVTVAGSPPYGQSVSFPDKADLNGDGLRDTIASVGLGALNTGRGMVDFKLSTGNVGSALVAVRGADGAEQLFGQWGRVQWNRVAQRAEWVDGGSPLPGWSPDTQIETSKGDFNGDGSEDLAWVSHHSNGTATTYRRLAPDNAKAGFLKTVVDGLGKQITVSYATQATLVTYGNPEITHVYSRGTACDLPTPRKTSVCVTKPGPLVSDHTESQVAAGMTNGATMYQYRYEGARKGTQGRNWFTFTNRWIYGPDTVTSIEYETDADYDPNTNPSYFLKVGKPKLVQTDTNLGIPASALGGGITTRTEVHRLYNAIDSSGRFSYLTGEGLDIREDQNVISATDATYTVDDYGNVSNSDVLTLVINGSGKVGAGTETKTIRIIENDTDNWLLGKVTRETITSTVGNASTTRTTTYGYGPLGDVEEVTREPDGYVAVSSTGPDGASNPYFRTWSVPDSYGNPRWLGEVDSPSAETGARMVTFTAWDESHIFPASITDKMGYPMSLSFAAGNGQPAQTSDGNGSVATRRYDSLGRLAAASSNGDESVYLYVPDSPTSGQTGQVIPVWGAIQMISFTNSGQNHLVSFDAFGRKVREVTNGLGNAHVEQSWLYDASGKLLQASEPHLLLGSIHDDTQGAVQHTYGGRALISTTLADGSTITYPQVNQYTATGAASSLFSSGGLGVHGSFMINPDGTTMEGTVRDVLGNIVTSVQGGVSGGSMSTSSYSYGPFGVPLGVVGPVGTTTIVPDVLGRATRVVDLATGTNYRSYDAWGEVVRQTDGNGATRTEYNAAGQPTALLSATGDVIAKWLYGTGDGSGNDNCTTGADNNLGARGKLIGAYRQSKTGATSGTWTCYGYSNTQLSHIEYAINGSPGEPLSGDQRFRTDYRHDNSALPSRVTGIDYPANAGVFGVNFAYDVAGVPYQVSSTQDSTINYWTLEAVEQGFRPSTEHLGNGTYNITNYFSALVDPYPGRTGVPCIVGDGNRCVPGMVSGKEVHRGASTSSDVIFKQFYSYDLNRNLSQVIDFRGSVTSQDVYTYDALQRLKTWNETLGTTTPTETASDTYTYDNAGNISNRATIGDYVYYPNNPFQLKTAGGTTHVWDAAGNLKTRTNTTVPGAVPGGTQTFTYDALNLPYSIADNSGMTTEFEYDASGARVVKRTLTSGQTTAVTLDIGELYQQVTEYDGGSAAATSQKHHYRIFAGGNQIAEIIKTQAADGSIGAASTTYLHQDRLGSAVMATDGTGAITSQQWFDPFGAQRAAPDATASNWDYATANSGFTGHQHDIDLGLVNMRGRLFDSRLGRFTKADPFVTEPFNPQGLNRYAYVQNNPLNFVDPSGFYDEGADCASYGCSGQGQYEIPQVVTPTYQIDTTAASPAPEKSSGSSQTSSGESSDLHTAPAAPRAGTEDANRSALQTGDRAAGEIAQSSMQQQQAAAQQTADAASTASAANARMTQPANGNGSAPAISVAGSFPSIEPRGPGSGVQNNPYGDNGAYTTPIIRHGIKTTDISYSGGQTNVSFSLTLQPVALYTEYASNVSPSSKYAGDPSITLGQHEWQHGQIVIAFYATEYLQALADRAGIEFSFSLPGRASTAEIGHALSAHSDAIMNFLTSMGGHIQALILHPDNPGFFPTYVSP